MRQQARDREKDKEKKETKELKKTIRQREKKTKELSWKYGLGAAAVVISAMCIWSLFTISRSTIVTIELDNAEQLKEVPSKYIADPQKLSLWIQKYSEPTVKELSWTDSFKKHCLMKDHCVILHTKSKMKKPSWLPNIMRKYRKTRFVSINRSHHKTSLDDKVKLGKGTEAVGLSVLSKTTVDGADKYSHFVYRGEWEEAGVEAAVSKILEGKGDAPETDKVELEDTPWFDAPPKGTRTKKTEQATDKNKEWQEKRRAQRSEERQQRRQQQQQQQSQDRQQQKQRPREEEEPQESRRGGAAASDSDSEDRRLRAARRAEEQLSEDDDVVVSDIEEDDDHLI